MATVSVTCLCGRNFEMDAALAGTDRKSTRLNSSHSQISYAVFCLKKKKNETAPASLLDRAIQIVKTAREASSDRKSHIEGHRCSTRESVMGSHTRRGPGAPHHCAT